MKRRIAVRGIIYLDGKILCVKHSDYSLNKGDYYATPGGGLNEGEQITEGLERELIEELGVKPIIGKLLYVQQFIINDLEQLEFFFSVVNSKDYLNIDLSKTTHGELELKEVGFMDPKTIYLLPQFLAKETIDINQTETKLFYYSK